MITRYALFQGRLQPGCDDAFRAAVREELLPTWQVYPGLAALRVSFAIGRDAAAPEMPLVLAMDFPDQAALDRALHSAERLASRAATQSVLPRFFAGQIHHYITETETYPPPRI